MIFAGIYSEKYRGRYEAIAEQIDALPDAVNCWREIPQQVFDEPYAFPDGQKCEWCRRNPCRFPFHHGCDVKIQHIVDLMDEHPGDLLVYTDCDVVFKRRDHFLGDLNWIKTLLDQGEQIVFQREGAGASPRWPANVNIGLNVCRMTEEPRAFFAAVLEQMHTREYPHNWDQRVVNELLVGGYQIHWYAVPPGVMFEHAKAGGKA